MTFEEWWKMYTAHDAIQGMPWACVAEHVREAAQKALVDELAKEVDEELAKGDSDNA